MNRYLKTAHILSFISPHFHGQYYYIVRSQSFASVYIKIYKKGIENSLFIVVNGYCASPYLSAVQLAEIKCDVTTIKTKKQKRSKSLKKRKNKSQEKFVQCILKKNKEILIAVLSLIFCLFLVSFNEAMKITPVTNYRITVDSINMDYFFCLFYFIIMLYIYFDRSTHV